ncbi:MAG: extracellular solute-binding protein [Catonella sp.]
MRKHKKLLAAFLGITMAVSMLSACGNGTSNEKTSTKPGSTAASAKLGSTAASGKTSTTENAKPVDVTVAIWGIEDALSDPDDAILKTLEEKTGVHLIPQNITWDDAEQKVQLWSTNGQLPDIFVGDFVAKSFFGNWIEQGTIRALPDDLSAYPNLAEYLKMERAQAAMRDGKYYMIPRRTYKDISYSVLDRNVVYRWDLAQKAGVTKEPETYEEFADMIKKIVKADPEKKSITGLTQLSPNMLSGFILPYGGILEKKWVTNKEGKFVPSYFADRDALVAAMELARKYYTEGVVEKDVALAKIETSKEKFLKGESAAVAFAMAGPAGLYNNMSKDYEQLYPDRKFINDIKIAKLYPGSDGKKHYFVDTEAWSESYFSSNVDDEKMAAICKLYDFLCSEEGRRLMFCGIEGEDYELKDGKVVVKDGVDITNKYKFIGNSSANSLAMWNPSSWDMSYPSAIPTEYRQLSDDRHKDAEMNGTLPKYYDSVLFLSTPLKNEFTFNVNDDFMQIMMGTEPVADMVDELLKNYENNGLSAMIDEVNQAAAEQGITK